MSDDVATAKVSSDLNEEERMDGFVDGKEVGDESPTDHGVSSTGTAEPRVEEVKLVPVVEAIRYRKRAQAAEKRVDELQVKLSEVESHLHETKRQIDDARRDREVRHALIDAGALDVETARLLVENVLGEGTDEDVERGIGEVVRMVRERKPFLFRSEQALSSEGAVMGGHLRPQQIRRATPIHHAASEARQSGRRQDLLRYMRLRRTEH